MWCQAGFDPDQFWHQTPSHFQLTMRGVRKRLSAEADARLRQAWWGAAFGGLTQSKGGLKPLEHYLKPTAARPRSTPADLHDVLRRMQAHGVPMMIRKVRRRGKKVKEVPNV